MDVNLLDCRNELLLNSFPTHSNPGVYCLFSFEDSLPFVHYNLNQKCEFHEILRIIQSCSVLPAVDEKLKDVDNYIKSMREPSENPFFRGFFEVTKYDSIRRFSHHVIYSLENDSRSRRWWRRHINDPVPLDGISVPDLFEIDMNFKDIDKLNSSFDTLSDTVEYSKKPSNPLLPCSVNTDTLYGCIPHREEPMLTDLYPLSKDDIVSETKRPQQLIPNDFRIFIVQINYEKLNELKKNYSKNKKNVNKFLPLITPFIEEYGIPKKSDFVSDPVEKIKHTNISNLKKTDENIIKDVVDLHFANIDSIKFEPY
jgi:hypothetical protein